MKKLKRDDRHILLLGIVIAVLSVAGVLSGIFLYNTSHESPDMSNQARAIDTVVRWGYDQQKDEWLVSQGATAPACKEPFVFDYTPVDLSLVTHVGFPGTYRGNDYKVHGTFALSESSIVKLPADATLSSIVRYLEGDPAELQYKVNFEMDCGISFYFDHLRTLSPQLEDVANILPEPELDNTRVDPDRVPPRLRLKAGDVIATATGAHQLRRYGIDFGVIDYRQCNPISYNQKWAAMHNDFRASEWHGVCWLALLPGEDAGIAAKLSAVQFDTRRTAKLVSDYCENADYQTIDLLGGMPVESY